MEPRPTQPDPVAAARSLAAALTTLADALTRADVARVLEAEPALTTALALMKTAGNALAGTPIDEGTRRALGAELDAARRALVRCAALGVSLESFVRGRGFASATYSRSGASSLNELCVAGATGA
jgi:hypothetical protein